MLTSANNIRTYYVDDETIPIRSRSDRNNIWTQFGAMYIVVDTRYCIDSFVTGHKLRLYAFGRRQAVSRRETLRVQQRNVGLCAACFGRDA